MRSLTAELKAEPDADEGGAGGEVPLADGREPALRKDERAVERQLKTATPREEFPALEGRILHPLGEPNIPSITEDAFRSMVSTAVGVGAACEAGDGGAGAVPRVRGHGAVEGNLGAGELQPRAGGEEDAATRGGDGRRAEGRRYS